MKRKQRGTYLKKSLLDNGDCVLMSILTVIREFESTCFGLAVEVFAGSCEKCITFLVKTGECSKTLEFFSLVAPGLDR